MRAIPSEGYGQSAAMQRQQQAVPMSGPADLPRSRPEPTDLFAPSQRPDEPVTAGADFGPGPGSEALPMSPDVMAQADPIEAELRALYAAYPNEDLRELIEDLED